MKIINIGILAHVDAGKTMESLLYASRAFQNRSVEKGTTGTDTMLWSSGVGLPFKRQSLPLMAQM